VVVLLLLLLLPLPMSLQLEAKLQAGDLSCWEKPGRIIVWAQWANLDGQPPEKQEVPPGPWFDEIKAAAGDSYELLVLLLCDAIWPSCTVEALCFERSLFCAYFNVRTQTGLVLD
jgi:hypothetical protein